MRIRIAHHTTYRYERPVRSINQILRLTPPDTEDQQVISWRIDFDVDGSLRGGRDPLGNITHSLTIDGPVNEMTLSVTGEVHTQDSGGLVRGTYEPFSPDVFLRQTDLTEPNGAIREFSLDIRSSHGDALQAAHGLLAAIHRDIAFDTEPTHVATTAAESFAMRKGVCQDLTHVFLAAVRLWGVPARYVSGYFKRVDGVDYQDAGHAWAEAWLPEVGWIGFDPANGICVTPAHVRVAIGLDYLGAAPVRGSRYGGGRESLSVALHVAEAAMRQRQE